MGSFFRAFWLAMLIFAATVLAVATARAQTAAPGASPTPISAPALTPTEAARALEVLQDPAKRAQVIDALKAIGAVSAPTAAATPTPAPTPSPATAASAAKLSLPPDSLGAQLVVLGSGLGAEVSQDLVWMARVVTDAPALWRALVSTASDPYARAQAFAAGWRLGLTLAGALLVEALVAFALRRPLAALATDRSHPAEPMHESGEAASSEAPPDDWRLAQRLPLALLKWILTLLPVAAFAGAGALLMATPIGDSYEIRFLIVEALKAYVVCRVIVSVAAMLASSRTPRLRLLHVGDRSAAAIETWVRVFAVVTVVGGTLAESAEALDGGLRLHHGIVKIEAFMLNVLLLTFVVQSRATVGRWLHAREGASTPFALVRNRLADTWHFIAIFVIVALWFVFVARLQAGLSGSLQLIVVSAGVVTIARLCAILALGAFDRLFSVSRDVSGGFPGQRGRGTRYYPWLRRTVSLIVAWITLVVLFEIWGVDAMAWFRSGEVGGRLISALITIGLAVAGAVAAWEVVNSALDRRLTMLSQDGSAVRSARLRTLMPILRTSLLISILTIVGLTVLSEIGVNVAPLLAGAGIVGIAIGFGSQKLVQDVITGLFLLLENAIQVGDWVTVSGLSGSVEKLSIRTIQLRAGDGALHIVPFSSVTSVTNANRGIGNAAVGVSVDYAEDTDRVGEALKQIAVEMRQDPQFKTAMLSELQLWGVDRVDGASATIAGQIVCTDAGRWSVQREFNRRMKRKFQQLGIVISAPNRSFLIREPSPPVADETPNAPPREEAPEPAPARAGRR